MKIDDLSRGEVGAFIERYGKRAVKVVEILAKQQPYIKNVVTSPLGADLLVADVHRAEELLDIAIEKELTPDERAELKYLKGRIARIAERLQSYMTNEKLVVSSIRGE